MALAEQSNIFFSSTSRAIQFLWYQWSSPIFSVAPAEQSDFFFSAVPAEHVSQAPTEYFSAPLVEQSDFFCDAHQFFSLALVKQYDFFSSLIFFSSASRAGFRGTSRAFFSGASGAVRFFQWHLLISFSGTVWFFHQFDFFQQHQRSSFQRHQQSILQQCSWSNPIF